MSNFPSKTLAVLAGAAIGAGVTYVLLKDKEELQETCDKGMLAVGNLIEGLIKISKQYFLMESNYYETEARSPNN